nr:HAMP domain-containing sensor histidine kinase [Micromonospora sp. DSM 115978]
MVLLLPFLVGLLGRVEINSSESRTALVIDATTMASFLILLGVVTSAARHLDQSDEMRLELELQVRKERDYVARVFSSVLNGIIVFDADFTVLRTNDYFCDLIRRDWREVVGQRPPFPWSADVTEIGVGRLTADGDAMTTDTTLRRSDGTEVVTTISMRRLTIAGEARHIFIASVLDVDSRVTAERTLARQADELRQRNAELADANQLKVDLMAMLSHEIGQPLATVIGFSELLEDELASPDGVDAANADDYTKKISVAAGALDDLVKDLLMMFRLEARRVVARPEAVDLHTLVTDAVAPLATPVAVHVPDRVLVRADPAQLRRVFSNLVHNAFKYGEPPISVTSSASDGQVSLTV